MKTLLTGLLFSILLASLISGCNSDGTSSGDNTLSAVEIAKRTGAQDFAKVQADGITANVFISGAAQKIVDNRQFDTPDPDFQVEKLKESISTELSWMMSAYNTIFDRSPITEFFFMIDDLGERRSSTICETTINTRIMTCDVRRIQKYTTGKINYRLPMSMIHEYTHLNQYSHGGYVPIPLTVSPAGKLPAHDREIKAIFAEMAGLVQKYGIKDGAMNYARLVGGLACTKEIIDITDESLLNQTARRCQVGSLPYLVFDKRITSGITEDPQAMFFSMAKKITASPLQGYQALDQTFIDLALKLDHAEALQLNNLRKESANLFVAPPRPAEN